MNKGITVLSLFDGMSSGMIALERSGIKVANYYASEIDKNAIKVSKANYPNIIHIGDVTKVSYADGVLYTEHGNYNVGTIDMVIGGSPCQDFSSLTHRENTMQSMLKQIAEFYGLYLEWSMEDKSYVLGDYQGTYKLIPSNITKEAFRALCEEMNPFA